MNRTLRDHLGKHTTPALQRSPQAISNTIHDAARFAWDRNLEHGFPHPELLSFRERHDVQTVDHHVLKYRARLEPEIIQHATRHHQDLPAICHLGMEVSVESAVDRLDRI